MNVANQVTDIVFFNVACLLNSEHLLVMATSFTTTETAFNI